MPVKLNGATSGSVTIDAPAVAGTNTLTLPAVTDTLVGLAATQTLTNKSVALSAGTASIAPLGFAAGTNLTTALAGAIEYDGKVFYGTPQGTQRGIIPGAQFFRLNANRTGLNQTTTQTVFGVGVALSASTVYQFEGIYIFQRLTGGTATSQTMGAGFTYTGTVDNFGALYTGNLSSANGSPSNLLTLNVSSITPVACTTSAGSAVMYSNVSVKGTISVTTGGTLTPQYITSATAGAFDLLLGSYFSIYPIGVSGANTSVGAWA